MPSFLNPLKTIVGGIVDIQIGSKWRRVKVDIPTQERFVGQEVEIVAPVHPEWGSYRVWMKRKHMNGTWSTPRHISKESFIEEFEPFVINLENK